MKSDSSDLVILKKWHLVLAILASIVVPSVSATGAFYSFQLKQAEKDATVQERITRLELSNQKSFADKDALTRLETKVETIHDAVIKLQTYVEKHL